ncbi:hypothetical protein BOX15_Mlig000548g3, partial [Macrostomum lignano]
MKCSIVALSLLMIVIVCIQDALGNQLTVVNVPSGVKLSSSKQASLADVRALPLQLFGLDETQSGLVSDVSFFRRPSLLAIIAFACGDACAEVDSDIRAAISGASAQRSFRLDGSDDALTYQPTGLAEAAARAGLSKSLLAGSSDLADSSHPGLFAGAEAADSLPAALSDDSSLPAEIRRQLRLARALADRAVASGLLADSQPDALRVDIPTVGLTADARRRVVEFAVK